MYYLDTALYLSIIAGKGFNVFNKLYRRITETPAERHKTGATENVRILLEQAIRHLERFRIISN